jgi:hypothetical protein
LLKRRVAFIERPVSACGKRQQAGQIAIEVDVEFPIRVGGKLYSVDQGPQEIGSFRTVLTGIENAGEIGNLLTVVRGHVRMKQYSRTIGVVD